MFILAQPADKAESKLRPLVESFGYDGKDFLADDKLPKGWRNNFDAPTGGRVVWKDIWAKVDLLLVKVDLFILGLAEPSFEPEPGPGPA